MSDVFLHAGTLQMMLNEEKYFDDVESRDRL